MTLTSDELHAVADVIKAELVPVYRRLEELELAVNLLNSVVFGDDRRREQLEKSVTIAEKARQKVRAEREMVLEIADAARRIP